MKCKNLAILLSALSVVAATVILVLAKQRPARHAERLQPDNSPEVQGATSPLPKLPPPTWAEVESAVHRVFGDDLQLEAHRAGPAFIVGDFNGDQSEDLAVIARPAPGKLAELNSSMANWIIQDADVFFVAPADQRVVRPPAILPPRLAAGEEVLAIIHGDGPQGWRNAEARQAYIVKHAAATLLGTAPSSSQEAVRTMRLPVTAEIIQELRRNKKGFLFWTGAAYACHPAQS